MTIDEAIKIENKIAEENQKIVDTQIVFDDVSLSQLYYDDTEVIEEHLSNYRKCAQYHEQLAEWLEELKDHRERECNHINEALYDKGYSDGYNKAIEYFVMLFKSRTSIENSTVDEIAEQLKEGVSI